jgi:hypothetical protein
VGDGFLENSAIHEPEHKMADSRRRKMTKFGETPSRKDRHCTHDVTLRCFLAKITAVESNEYYIF